MRTCAYTEKCLKFSKKCKKNLFDTFFENTLTILTRRRYYNEKHIAT